MINNFCNLAKQNTQIIDIKKKKRATLNIMQSKTIISKYIRDSIFYFLSINTARIRGGGGGS